MKSEVTLWEGGQILKLIFDMSNVSLETIDKSADIGDIAWIDASNRLLSFHGVAIVSYVYITPTGTCTRHLN